MRYVFLSYIYAIFGSYNPKSTCTSIKRYRIHNHRVKSIVPSDKLLVYNVKQGWKPLCDFFECDVPTVAFPHENVDAELTKTLPLTRLYRQVRWEVQRGVFAIGSVHTIILISVLAICFS